MLMFVVIQFSFKVSDALWFSFELCYCLGECIWTSLQCRGHSFKSSISGDCLLWGTCCAQRVAAYDSILSVCLVQTECEAFHVVLIWCCFECWGVNLTFLYVITSPKIICQEMYSINLGTLMVIFTVCHLRIRTMGQMKQILFLEG